MFIENEFYEMVQATVDVHDGIEVDFKFDYDTKTLIEEDVWAKVKPIEFLDLVPKDEVDELVDYLCKRRTILLYHSVLIDGRTLQFELQTYAVAADGKVQFEVNDYSYEWEPEA